MKKLLTAAQVGEALGLSEDTARRYARQHMECVMLPGGDLRVEEAELERWLSGFRQPPKNIFEAAARKPKARPKPAFDPELFEPDGRIKRRRSS